MKYANLEGAYFEGANLDGANLEGALYDKRATVWPKGFDFKAAGAVTQKELSKNQLKKYQSLGIIQIPNR